MNWLKSNFCLYSLPFTSQLQKHFLLAFLIQKAQKVFSELLSSLCFLLEVFGLWLGYYRVPLFYSEYHQDVFAWLKMMTLFYSCLNFLKSEPEKQQSLFTCFQLCLASWMVILQFLLKGSLFSFGIFYLNQNWIWRIFVMSCKHQ